MKSSITRSFSKALDVFYSRAQNTYVNRLQRLKTSEVNKLFLNFNVKNLRWLSSLTNSQLDNGEVKSKEKVKFSFILPSGERVDVEGKIGDNIMNVGADNEVGMEGACEGSLACTTCHAYVDEKLENILPEPCAKEEDLLDTAPFLKMNSRLCCQIIVSKEIEGATFKLPPATVNMSVDGHKPKKH